MADVYGVNRTIIEAGGVNQIDPEEVGAKVKWVYDEYEASALAAASSINVCQDLPVDARVVDWIIDHDAFGTGVNFRFGTVADTDEFMTDTAATSADRKNFTDDAIAATLGFPIESGSGQKLVITLSGPSTATGTIKVAVAYATKG